jgi:Asp/Glu/hydantoin racemase
MKNQSLCGNNMPFIGILMLETTFPRIKGDIGNPETFSFPVRFQTVHGASPKKVVIDADMGLIENFIDAGEQLVAKGAKAIATSCGFLALFHQQISSALPVPVFTSSLLQAHLIQSLIRKDQKIGIITANRPALTHAHLAGVGIQQYPLAIVGMEEAQEFNAVFIEGKATLDEHKCRLEMQSVAEHLIENHPDVGIIILECTNMPPYAGIIRQVTGRPVFDAVTMVRFAYSAISSEGF